jgi:hypothetical protein
MLFDVNRNYLNLFKSKGEIQYNNRKNSSESFKINIKFSLNDDENSENIFLMKYRKELFHIILTDMITRKILEKEYLCFKITITYGEDNLDNIDKYENIHIDPIQEKGYTPVIGEVIEYNTESEEISTDSEICQIIETSKEISIDNSDIAEQMVVNIPSKEDNIISVGKNIAKTRLCLYKKDYDENNKIKVCKNNYAHSLQELNIVQCKDDYCPFFTEKKKVCIFMHKHECIETYLNRLEKNGQ